jgi:hypothetical protein
LGYGIPNFRGAYYGALLGLNEEIESGSSIYPNPLRSESLHIRFGKELRVTLQILDGSGRRVVEQVGERNTIQQPFVFYLSDLPSGIYFLQLLDGKEIAYKKLIKL